MNCPNCSNVFLMGNICPNCGIDVVLFEKTIKISDVLYNKGLNLSKVRDLWGATESLTKSIQFNKNNYYARNLLGLVYYETGRIGDALKHWIISASLVKQDNPAIRYIDYFQKEGKRIDLYNDAIKMYNQALLYIQQKSDDMAIIQLKKAIEINPKFVDAMNLLSFCYLIQNEKDLASELVNAVLQLDVNNQIALNYYGEIHNTNKRPKPAYKIEPKSVPAFTGAGGNKLTPEESKKGFGDNFHFAEIFSFIIGGICTLALGFTLIMPGMLQEKEQRILELQNQLELDNASNLVAAQKSQNEIEKLQEEIEALTAANTEYEFNARVDENTKKINNAANYYSSSEYEEAAAILLNINPAEIDEDMISQYESLKTNVFPRAEETVYNRAVAEYNRNNYDDAKMLFKASLEYATDDSTLKDDVVYYYGQIAEAEDDIDMAITHYTNIVENFRNSNRYNNALSRLNALEQE